MKRNLTITLEDDLLRAARKIAIDRNTSVNALLREHLKTLVSESGRQGHARAQLKEFFRTTQARIGNRTWTRDELHER